MHEFKRRFPPAPSYWQRKKISAIVDRVTTRNVERHKNVLTISAEFGLISQSEYFSRRVASESVAGYFLLANGDFAYNKSYSRGYPLGVIRRLDRYEKGCVSPLYICFRPRADEVDSDFLLHYVDGGALDEGLANVAKEGVRNHGLLNVGVLDFLSLEVSLPPMPEQRKLAQLLNAIDTTIQGTEAIIEKLKRVKQGMLHDLLSRGIDANGELRAPQSAAPYLYKDSPLGWIPVAWRVDRLDQLLSNDQPAMRSGPFGSALLKSELIENGVPLLGIDNVHAEEFVAKFTRFVPLSKFYELTRYAVRPNDLMITIMGTVGRCCIVPENVGRALSSKHTWTITLDRSKYSPQLAMLQINHSPCILAQFAKDEQGGVMSAIRSDTLRGLMFPVPPIAEQTEIEARMQAVTDRIETESKAVIKMRLEKSGLMDDLLTGRVRVTSLLETTRP
jgi:type I restriction enzyme S subunit